MYILQWKRSLGHHRRSCVSTNLIKKDIKAEQQIAGLSHIVRSWIQQYGFFYSPDESGFKKIVKKNVIHFYKWYTYFNYPTSKSDELFRLLEVK